MSSAGRSHSSPVNNQTNVSYDETESRVICILRYPAVAYHPCLPVLGMLPSQTLRRESRFPLSGDFFQSPLRSLPTKLWIYLDDQPSNVRALEPFVASKARAGELPELGIGRLDTLKYIVTHYVGFLWALLKPLGSWAVFAIAGIDSAFFGVPLDPVVATYVYQNRSHALLYPFMAAAGSAVGCVILYWIGYRGGEVLLLKRMSRLKFDRIRASFDRHEFWALMVPSMLPPPFPFKAVVLAASAFEMNFWHFLLAIFLGRLLRFVLLALLVLEFGPQVLAFAAAILAGHWILIILFCVAVIAAGIYACMPARE
jgi:membrane protein YqaA with SNARE-associated domain